VGLIRGIIRLRFPDDDGKRTVVDVPADASLDRGIAGDPEASIADAAKRFSNWGRWGAEDVRGTLNFLVPAKRLEGAMCVRRGASFSLSQPFDAHGPQRGWGRRTNPVHTMLDTGLDAERGQGFPHGIGGADDVIFMPLQCPARQRVMVGRGDIVLVRTGQLTRTRRDGWGEYAGGDAPGLSFNCAGWLHGTEIAAIATDTWGFEVRPNEFEVAFQPLHQVAIPHLGLTIGEMWDLDALAADCASDGVFEFFLVTAPLPVTGAVGAPVNPIAVK
jgi:hypothetical protein